MSSPEVDYVHTILELKGPDLGVLLTAKQFGAKGGTRTFSPFITKTTY